MRALKERGEEAEKRLQEDVRPTKDQADSEMRQIQTVSQAQRCLEAWHNAARMSRLVHACEISSSAGMTTGWEVLDR